MIFECPVDLAPREARKELASIVNDAGGWAVYGFKPTPRWTLVVVATGLDSGHVDRLHRRLQDISPEGRAVSIRSFDVRQLADTLDQVMPRLGHFFGHPNMLKEWLKMNFGQQVIHGRAARAPKPGNGGVPADSSPKVDGTPKGMVNGSMLSAEAAAAAFEARRNGVSQESRSSPPNASPPQAPGKDGPGASLSYPGATANTNGHAVPQPGLHDQAPRDGVLVDLGSGAVGGNPFSLPEGLAAASPSTNGAPGMGSPSGVPHPELSGDPIIVDIGGGRFVHPMFAANGFRVPEGWAPASLSPDDAYEPGLPCRTCWGPTFRGYYRLAGSRLIKTRGSGPEEIDVAAVFDPTGELKARSRADG